RRHTRFSRDWSSDVCSSDLTAKRGNEHCLETARTTQWPKPTPAMGANGCSPKWPLLHSSHSPPGLDKNCTKYDHAHQQVLILARSEERRVGKECRSRWWRGR